MQALAPREQIVEEERDEDAERGDDRQDVVVELGLDDARRTRRRTIAHSAIMKRTRPSRVSLRARSSAAASAAGSSAAHSHMPWPICDV